MCGRWVSAAIFVCKEAFATDDGTGQNSRSATAERENPA